MRGITGLKNILRYTGVFVYRSSLYRVPLQFEATLVRLSEPFILLSIQEHFGLLVWDDEKGLWIVTPYSPYWKCFLGGETIKGVKKGDNNNQFFCFFSIIFLKSFGFVLVQHRLLSQFALFFGNCELPPVTTSLDFLKSLSHLISVYYLSRSSFYAGWANQNSLITYSSTENFRFFFPFGVWLLAQDLRNW